MPETENAYEAIVAANTAFSHAGKEISKKIVTAWYIVQTIRNKIYASISELRGVFIVFVETSSLILFKTLVKIF